MDVETRQTNTGLTCSEENRYTVKKGDTMTGIARQYGVSAADLMALNPYVSPNMLVIGQVICVPKKQESPQIPPAQAEEGEKDDATDQTTPEGGLCAGPCCALCPEGWTREVVRPGESYTDLLRRYDISLRAMRIANPRLLPGLMIPGQGYCVPPEDQRRSACPSGSRSYTLTPGETLSSVAEKVRMSEGRLRRLNPDRAPSEFRVGATVCVGNATSSN